MRGGQVFAQCKVCHSLEAGKNMLGPSRHGLIGAQGRQRAGICVFAAMKNSNLTWNKDTLSKYLTDPKAFIRGDKMAFTGIKEPEQAWGPSCIS